jgi:hypothetical protein
MTKCKAVFIGALFMSVITSAQTTATTPDAQSLPSELANFNTAWLAARKAGDKKSLDRMTTEDFRITNDSGRVLEKAEFLKSAEPLPPDEQSRFEDVEIRMLGKDAAVMFVRLLATNRSLSGITVDFREMKVFRRTSSGWKLAAVQATQVATQRQSTMLPESTLRQYVGVYERSAGDQLNVTLAGGRLFGERSGFAKREYLPMSDCIFYATSSATTYIFIRDQQGAVQSVEMLVYGNVLNFKRVN